MGLGFVASGFMILGFRIWDCRVPGFRVRDLGLGFRVQGFRL